MKDNSGFSTVELLVTLFIAAAFLVSGYQLYSVIIKDGGETRRQAKASNLAYDYLQQYKIIFKKQAGICVSQEVLPFETETQGLSNVTVGIVVTCPYTEVPKLVKIVVTVKYGDDNPQKQIVQATYVNKE